MTFIGLLIIASGLFRMTLTSVPEVRRPGIRGLRDPMSSGGIHYSWVIVAILAVVQIIGSSIGMSAGIIVPILNDPTDSFGWSMATIGAAFMVYYLTGALFAPISGWLGDLYGPRRMLLAGSLLYGSSMILMGIVSQSWHFFFTFSFMLALTQSISMVSLMAAVSGWFRRRLGLATGILWAAGGIGSAGLAPLVSYLMGQVVWQATFWSIGIIGGSILFLLATVFPNRPADLGLRPYGLETTILRPRSGIKRWRSFALRCSISTYGAPGPSGISR
jgi:MFS family permease